MMEIYALLLNITENIKMTYKYSVTVHLNVKVVKSLHRFCYCCYAYTTFHSHTKNQTGMFSTVNCPLQVKKLLK